jgi:hypothetical protein
MSRQAVPYKGLRGEAAMVADLPSGFCSPLAGLSWIRGGPEHNLGDIFQAKNMATPCQFNVGDRVALRGSGGTPDPRMTGVIEKADFLGPSGGGAQHCLYVVRLPNGQLFAAWGNELVQFE